MSGRLVGFGPLLEGHCVSAETGFQESLCRLSAGTVREIAKPTPQALPRSFSQWEATWYKVRSGHCGSRTKKHSFPLSWLTENRWPR